MKHPHYDVMVEWAADTSKAVQFFANGKWHDVAGTPLWDAKQYRIKPEKKPDVVKYAQVTQYTPGRHNFDWIHGYSKTAPNVAFHFDGETGKLIKAEVL